MSIDSVREHVESESGVADVFVHSRAGGRFQVSVGGGIEPVWNRHGKELLYRTPSAVMSAQLGSRRWSARR